MASCRWLGLITLYSDKITENLKKKQNVSYLENSQIQLVIPNLLFTMENPVSVQG
jgi:hypothetical protein